MVFQRTGAVTWPWVWSASARWRTVDWRRSMSFSRRRRSGGLKRKTAAGCSEQCAKAPSAVRAATVATLLEMLLTSPGPPPLWQARAKEKARQKLTAKGATLSSCARPSDGRRTGGKSIGASKNEFSWQCCSCGEYGHRQFSVLAGIKARRGTIPKFRRGAPAVGKRLDGCSR